jgi:hypothetical protein
MILLSPIGAGLGNLVHFEDSRKLSAMTKCLCSLDSVIRIVP